MIDEEIISSGKKELEKIGFKNKEVRRWKNMLLDYKFDNEYQDDKYIWLTNILALKGVDSGNFGVGSILVDNSGSIIAQGHNEVFNPYFRSDRHAEMVVMDEFEDMNRNFIYREDLILYTSLESCPMCMVRLITSGVRKILHAAPDIEGGMVHVSRNVPQFWNDLCEGKTFSQAQCSQEMINAAGEIFRLNVEELIQKIKNIHAPSRE